MRSLFWGGVGNLSPDSVIRVMDFLKDFINKLIKLKPLDSQDLLIILLEKEEVVVLVD